MATASYQYHVPASSLRHDRLHRRTTSSSSLSTITTASPHLTSSTYAFPTELSSSVYTQRLPPLPPLITRPSAPRRKMSYEEYYDDYAARAASPAHGGSSFKIKPYLRKMSLKDDTRIDLSKPAAENETLAGLNLGQDPLSAVSARSTSDFSQVTGRRGHARSGSNTSQYSVSSMIQRPTAPYAHPMRATPRPYTPPITKSGNASVHENDFSDENTLSEEELRYRQALVDQITRRESGFSIAPLVPPKLHQTRSTSSLTRYTNNNSQSSLAINNAMPLGKSRSRGNTLRSVDSATSPSSRPSFDKTLSNILRSVKSDEPVDRAASRAASIRAARQAYTEREEQKNRRRDEKEFKRRSKEEKRQKRSRAKSDAAALEELRQETRVKKGRKAVGNTSGAKQQSRSHPNLLSTFSFDEKRPAATKSTTGLVARAYDETTASNVPAIGTQPLGGYDEKFPSFSATADLGAHTSLGGKRAGPYSYNASGKGSGKDKWLSFMAWVRTRMLRAGDNMGHH